ncbi:MAG TPA: hypothetical protein PL105_22165, partial [Caldilineaceae bacterium]|nr:hypothetical protein [Caldilineaceae bacterium]
LNEDERAEFGKMLQQRQAEVQRTDGGGNAQGMDDLIGGLLGKVAGRAVGGDRLITRETLDCAWFAEDEIPWAAVTPSHLTRIRHAFAWHKEPTTPVFFDRVTWQPEATNQHAGATRPE